VTGRTSGLWKPTLLIPKASLPQEVKEENETGKPAKPMFTWKTTINRRWRTDGCPSSGAKPVESLTGHHPFVGQSKTPLEGKECRSPYAGFDNSTIQHLTWHSVLFTFKKCSKLEALGQHIPPPPRHILPPVSRYQFCHLANQFEMMNPKNNPSTDGGKPDCHQNLIVCSLAHCQPSLKISCKSVWKFLLTDKQTNKQWWKHDLLGRGQLVS